MNKIFKGFFSFINTRLTKINSAKFSDKISESLYSVAKFFRHTKIGVRLIIIFVLLSSLPLFILGFFSYNKSSSALETKIKSFSSEVTAQSAKSVRSSMNTIEANLNEIQTNREIMEILNKLDQGMISQQDLSEELYFNLKSIFNIVSN